MMHGLNHTFAPYNVGSVWENRLGYQPIRVVGERLRWLARPCPAIPARPEWMDTLERDGVVTIPDFLRADVFAQVRAEFDAVRDEIPFKVFGGRERGRLHVATMAVEPGDDRFPALREHLVNSPSLCAAATLLTRRDASKGGCTTRLVTYQLRDEDAQDNDIENILHADAHFQTAKAWLLLNDADESNGALVFAKGSHRLNLKRLYHEYELSVRVARLNGGDERIPAHKLEERDGRKRNIITPETLKWLGYEESVVTGKAGTLVVANTLGFHRRSRFTSTQPREQVFLNYRYLEVNR
jgi:hypothetical protein